MDRVVAESRKRSELIEILKEFTNWGVEVGVQNGEFSREILKETKLNCLFMVDAYREIEGYKDIANVSNSYHILNLQTAMENTLPFQDRRTIIIDKSILAANLLYGVDFVYLDAAHDEDSVTQDILAWWPVIRSGGILCGDDYMDGDTVYAKFGVKSAVDNFALKEKLDKNIISSEVPQWWIRKP